MAYKDPAQAAAKKREWEAANPEKVKAAREAYNEKRRERRRDAVVRGDEAAIKRLMYREMNPEQKAAMLEGRKEYQRGWQKKHYAERYAAYKERMKTDPEFAAQERARQRARNAKRGNRKENETPQQRERRLQRNREYNAQKYREKKAMQALTPAKPKAVTPKVAPPPPPPVRPAPQVFKRKPGRLLAMAGWNGF